MGRRIWDILSRGPYTTLGPCWGPFILKSSHVTLHRSGAVTVNLTTSPRSKVRLQKKPSPGTTSFITCMSTSTRIAQSRIAIPKTVSQKSYPVILKEETVLQNPEFKKTESLKNRAQKSEARAGNRSLKIRLPKTIPFSDPLVFGSRLSGYGFADTVFWVLAFWRWFLGDGFFGSYPKNRIPKTGTEETGIQKSVPRKRGPKRPYPQNRIQKPTGSEKGVSWQDMAS